MPEKDYYSLLGVSPHASQAAIKKAYWLLAKQYHPDCARGNKAAAEEIFKKINEAYEVLSDFRKRAQYDQARKARTAQRTRGKTDVASRPATRSKPIVIVKQSRTVKAFGFGALWALLKYAFLFIRHYLDLHRILSGLVAMAYVYYWKTWADSLRSGSGQLILFAVFGFLLIWFRDNMAFYEARYYGGRFFAYVFLAIGWILLLLPSLSLYWAESMK